LGGGDRDQRMVTILEGGGEGQRMSTTPEMSTNTHFWGWVSGSA